MRYFVGTELGVSNLLQRHFDWTSNSLWFEEIPNATDPSKTMFLIGGKDSIINAEVSWCISVADNHLQISVAREKVPHVSWRSKRPLVRSRGHTWSGTPRR